MPDWFQNDHSNTTHDDDTELPFTSRRSPVLCRHACVATSQPLATSIGLDMLRRGANAADTAIAVAAALAVTEPCSTGLGGDMFCLYYNSSNQQTVTAINGSGQSAADLSFDKIRQQFGKDNGTIDSVAFSTSALAVTVPGAARGWYDLYTKYGSQKFTFAQLLEPATILAEEGFPVAPVTSHHWREGMATIAQHHEEPLPLTMDGKQGPKTGELFRNPDLAKVLKALGKDGPDAFYKGPVAQAIAEAVTQRGGCMTVDDLANHTSEFPDPISVPYRDVRLWQVPPNGQGIAGLIALQGLGHLEETNVIPKIDAVGTTTAYHAMIEMMRLGFADNRAHVTDPRYMDVTVEHMLDPQRINERATRMFDPNRATIAGAPDASSCTVSFQVVDTEGNAISFVNSNFMGFGTGIVPDGCGFPLQNRGFGFTLEAGHPNVAAPSKRPYHTIIPGILTHQDTGDLYATLSNMGGNMQPQGHLQLTIDMVAGGLDPQQAVDMPRFCIPDATQGGIVLLEKGVNDVVVNDLVQMGHKLQADVAGHGRSVFGRAQIIKRDRETGVLWAGSDGRADGCALGF